MNAQSPQFIAQGPGSPHRPHIGADSLKLSEGAPFDCAANVEKTFSTWALWQSGQSGVGRFDPSTSSSNLVEHSLHWYSKMGIPAF